MILYITQIKVRIKTCRQTVKHTNIVLTKGILDALRQYCTNIFMTDTRNTFAANFLFTSLLYLIYHLCDSRRNQVAFALVTEVALVTL